MDQLDAFKAFEGLLAEQVGSLGGQGRVVVQQPGQAVAVVLVPVRALAGLEAVLVVHLHKLARLHQPGEQVGNLLAELSPAFLQVLHQQVGQGFRRGANALVHAGVAGQLVDEEDQRQ